MTVSRRSFLRSSVLGAGVSAIGPRAALSREADGPPIRTITRGPRFHWFGYYDKLQFDPSGRYVLGMAVDFEDRDPKPDDTIRIGMIDLRDGDRWIDLGTSRAWCWQQGCMLQWRPGSDREVLWNDRHDGRWVCHVLDVLSGKKRTIPHSIYAVSPDGRSAVTVDYGRLHRLAPGYGYNGLPDRHPGAGLPADDGVWRVDLETGKARLIVPLRKALEVGSPMHKMADSPNYYKHLLYSPDGSRFIFLQRWYPDWPKRGRYTRMLTADPDGGDIRLVDGSGHTSHFIWRDPQHILAWTKLPAHGSRFYLFDERTGKADVVGKDVMTRNGHCTYLPGNEWILNDTYPQGPDRLQHVYLYHAATGRRVTLGTFHSPPRYRGTLRCDTHPRFSRDGRFVVIDSPHTSAGRQMHLIDVSAITQG